MHGVKRILLQHSSRGAALDRYSTIRNFFRQRPASSLPCTSSTLLSRLELSFGAHAARRQFSACASLRQENRQLPDKTREEGTSQLTSSAENGPLRKDGVDNSGLEQYPRFFRRLALSLPHLQRPTRDDFLKAADGFWQRARIRFRWITIRSFRRYNADEISAFFTWFLMSQTLWLFVGT